MKDETIVILTPFFARCLQIIREKEIHAPREFAREVWPDSAGWRRVVKCGHGSHRGGGMYLAGGGLIGKLRQRKLISWIGGDHRRPYSLTDLGERSLAAFEAEQRREQA